MSGSKLLRLCSLFLCLLLCLANFSVVANASEAEENLIDSDLRNWDKISEHDIWGVDNSRIFNLNPSSISDYYNIYFNSTSGQITYDMYGGFCELTNLIVGENYSFSIDLKCSADFFTEYYECFIGVCYFTADGVFYPYDDIDILTCSLNSTVFTTNTLDFTYSYNGYKPYVFIIFDCIKSNNSGVHAQLKNISLTRQPSETEKKLDGILGWLEDIKNSIVGLPVTIKTNLSTFFTDLSTKLTELKNNIKTNLETLGNNINGKLGDVSTDFSDYVSGLGDRVSSFFSDLKTNLTSEFTAFKNKVNTEFTNLKSNLTTNFDNLRSTLSSRFDKVDNFLTEIRDFFHNLYWDLVGGTCGAGDVHSSLFERLGDRIRGFFEDLKVKIDIKVEEIKTAIHDFFVPPEGFFEEWKANFDLMLSENLGFIYETPDLITGFVTLAKNILDTDTEPSIIFPEISFELPGEYGCEINLFEETEVDLSFLSESDVFSFLYYEAYPALLHVIFILALIGYAKYIWGRTMSN